MFFIGRLNSITGNLSEERMTSTFKDGCRLLSCLLVFSGPASAWACLSVIGGPAGAVTGMTASLSQGTPGDTHTHTFAALYPSTQSSHRNGNDRCCNQCEVCGNKRQQLTEEPRHPAAHTQRCGMTQIHSYSTRARVFMVMPALLSHFLCRGRRQK